MANSPKDVISAQDWAYLASDILKKLPEEGRPYLEAIKAPENWWNGIDKMVKKVTILTGALECLRDDNVNLAVTLKRYHEDVTLFVHPDGVHTEPYIARMVGEEVHPEVVDLMIKHFT